MSIDCITFHYYFLNKESKFQSSACNACHDVAMMSFVVNNVAILNIHGIDYGCIIVLSLELETITKVNIAYSEKVTKRFLRNVFTLTIVSMATVELMIRSM